MLYLVRSSKVSVMYFSMSADVLLSRDSCYKEIRS
jgi:hypothetical protein